MSSDNALDKLINQCKSNDVDVKVDALAKLQVLFESGIEIDNPEILVNIFKNSLRSSNQHLTNAAVQALLPFLPLLITRSQNGVIDAHTLRLVLATLLPLVIERLSDRDRVQGKARESIALLGGYSLKMGTPSVMSTRSRDGKGPETSAMIFERLLKELGLSSKVWKIREQSILVLVHIRRTYSQFPIRPYLSLLVDCLEDTDPHVRDCARTSVVELFSGSAVSDAARADLKKEMSKKGVRKAIMDAVISKVIGGSSSSNSQSHEGSDNGDVVVAKKEYIPPSLLLQGKRPSSQSVSSSTSNPVRTASYGTTKEVSRPESRTSSATPPPPPPPPATASTNENVDVKVVYIASSRDLENEFAAMAPHFEGKETEKNWADRENAIQRVRGMLKGDVHLRHPDVFLALLKDGFMQWTLKTLTSLRTTLTTNTCCLYAELTANLGPNIEPFCELLLTNLLKMAGLTKKIAANHSQSIVTTILTHTSAQPRLIIPMLYSALQEKTVQTRAFVVGHLKTYLELHGRKAKSAIEASGSLDILDKALRKAITDPNPSVRDPGRKLFWDFEAIWPEYGTAILNSLDATGRKQVERLCPIPERQSTLPPTTPAVPKKSSVAAAIAASRAKAKAIATAPPTLRHQATSSSHNQRRSQSPSSPTTSSRSAFTRPASPLRLSSSPPASRTLTSTLRSVTSLVMQSHSRTPSGKTRQGSSPVLPEPSTARQGTSSSSTTFIKGSTLRKAMQTALPASPPESTGQLSPTPKPPRKSVIPARPSSLYPQMANGTDESLLLAQTVPIPSDSESEDDTSMNVMPFSSPTKFRPPIKPITPPESQSPKSVHSRPTGTVSNALSSGSIANDSVGGHPAVVEDALKARAEQAESAAERLLELVEPDAESPSQSTLPPSLLIGHGNGIDSTLSSRNAHPPVTPANKAISIMRQAALFQDSPAHTGRTSLLEVLQETKQSWWAKRKQTISLNKVTTASMDPYTMIEEAISVLSENTSVDPSALYQVARLSINYAVPDISQSSPMPFDSSLESPRNDIWEKNKSFERLFRAMMEYLTPDKPSDVVEAGLVLISAFVENQSLRLEGKEAELFSMLLHIRYSNKVNLLEATNAIRDILTMKLEPVYGLTTMHASLKDFCATSPPSSEDTEIKAATYAFGLIALGKFILRLPAEVAEEELPRLRSTLISALNEKSSLIIRESAAASIIAAQLVLRDETHLFALLDGLADDKKNLLTYLFDKHGARGMTTSNGSNMGLDKLEKEIRRLDTRTSTPSRRNDKT